MMMDGKSVVRRRDARAGDLREERESKGKHMKTEKKSKSEWPLWVYNHQYY